MLSRHATFALLASIIPFYLGGSSAPTPIYPLYREAWGFSPITLTAIFAIYALVVLATLLVLGSLSDHIGRRPVLIVTALLQIGAMVAFVRADGVGTLVLARVLQGIAVGAATGAVGAALLDVHRERGTVVNALAPTLGTALGAIVSGLMVAYLPAPTTLVFVAFGGAFTLQLLLLALLPETATPRPGALASLRPHFRLPSAVRAPLFAAMPALIAAWATPGFYGSLGPVLMRSMLDTHSPLAGGLALFVLAGSGSIGVWVSRTGSAASAMRRGALALATGAAIAAAGVATSAVAVFFVGTVFAGLGFGASFQGAVRSIVAVAAEHERAGVLSVLYVVAYLALGLPAVLGGVGVAWGGSVTTTAEIYLLAVTLLAVIAIGGMRVLVPTPAAR